MVGKILIADDDSSIRSAAKIFFEGRGYQIITADNGKDAVSLVQKERPDFALVDIVMPEKNGFEVCGEIKDNEDTKDTVVIIFSGNVPEIERGFDYGADDCVIKPLDWESLSVRIENLAKDKRKTSDNELLNKEKGSEN